MSENKYYEITLNLDNIKQLFQQSEFDPFLSQNNYISGIDRIINELKSKPLSLKIKTTIILPENQISKNIERSTKEAIDRYCDVKIKSIANELAFLRDRGIKALRRGTIFLAICLLLSTFFDGIEFLPEFLHQFLSEGFSIAGWVSLWYPIELLLYQCEPERQEKKIYETIKNMELIITFEN